MHVAVPSGYQSMRLARFCGIFDRERCIIKIIPLLFLVFNECQLQFATLLHIYSYLKSFNRTQVMHSNVFVREEDCNRTKPIYFALQEFSIRF